MISEAYRFENLYTFYTPHLYQITHASVKRKPGAGAGNYGQARQTMSLAQVPKKLIFTEGDPKGPMPNRYGPRANAEVQHSQIAEGPGRPCNLDRHLASYG